jgi:hypothetical protein
MIELPLMPREVETLQKIRVDDRPDKVSMFLAPILATLSVARGTLSITDAQLATVRVYARDWKHGLQRQFQAIVEAAERLGV